MSKSDRPSRLARNAVAMWIAFLYAAIVGFFLSPFIVSHLGTTGYGVWSLLAGLVGYLGILDLGIRQAVSRYVARHRAMDDHGEASSIVSAAMVFIALQGILAILLSALIAYLVPSLFSIPESLVHDAQIIVVLGGLTVAINLLGGVFGGGVTGIQRFDVQCGVEIFVATFRTVAIVLALREGYGLVSLAFIHLATSVLNCAIYGAVIHKLYVELHLRFRGRLLPQIKTIFSFGASLSVIGALGTIVNNSDAVIAGAFLPIESVAFMAIAGSLYAYAREMTKALSYVIVPRISALAAVGSNRVGEEILLVAKAATLLAVAISATFVLRGESFITLWMGPAYGLASEKVLQVFAIALWLDASRSVVTHSLVGMAKQRVFIPGMAIEAVCKLVLSILLVRPFGIVGIALGTLIPSIVINVGYIPRCLSKVVGVPATRFLHAAILMPTLACLPFALASAVTERFAPAANLAVFFAQVIITLPMLPAAAWFLCLTATEKDQVRSEFRKWFGR